jgi:hypothetical protein
MNNQSALATEQNRVILYTTGDGKVTAKVFFANDTFWLTQSAMSELFGVNIPAISGMVQKQAKSGNKRQSCTA